MDKRLIKKIIFYLGVVFIFATLLIPFNPKPFLNLGYAGVFFFSLFGSGSLLVVTLAKELNPLVLAVVATAGMAINDCVSWYIGKTGEEVIPPSAKILRVENMLHKYGTYGLFFFAVIPFPYDFVGLIAGYLGFSFHKFFIPTFLGKLTKVIVLVEIVRLMTT